MKRLALLLMLAASPAMAQQPQAPQNPMEQALSAKLVTEINHGLQCDASLVGIEKRLAEVTKERDALKAKYEPPKPTPAKP